MDITLDLITLSSTPVDLFQNYSALRDRKLIAHNIYFQVHKNNTGDVYIGLKNMNITTQVGVINTLRPPTTNGLPSFSMEISNSQNPYSLNDYYVAGSVSGDKVQVTAQVA